MRSYDLIPDAEADLNEIAEYTLREWGVEQQMRYGELLESCFRRIASDTAISRQFSEHYPQVRVTRCEHHYVFYLQPEGTTVPRIIAVLHERMDMIARLRQRL